MVLAVALSPGAAAVTLEAAVGLARDDLSERAADGSTLVRETGWAPVAILRLSPPPVSRGHAAPSWGWQLQVQARAADARYAGRSQAGAPVDSRTASAAVTADAVVDRAIGAGWRIAAGGEVEQLTRRIRGTGFYAGLDERTTQPRWLVGLQGPVGPWRLEARATTGPGGPLRVRFDRGFADPVRLATGRSAGWSLEARRAVAGDWHLAATVGRRWIAAGPASPLTAGGQPLGTVQQPRWVSEQVAVTVGRTWP